MHRSRLALLVPLGAALLVACSTLPGSSASVRPPAAYVSGASLAASQTEDLDGITLTAMWEDPGRFLKFHIKLDNHVVDLDGITLASATLRNDHGQTLTPDPWTAPPGGHHRDGWLTFRGDPTAFLAGANWVELRLPPIGTIRFAPLRWSPSAS